MTLTRRRLLKLTGGLIAVTPFTFAALRPSYAQDVDPEMESEIDPAPRPFGRTIHAGFAVRERPDAKATVVRRLALNEVIPLLGQIQGNGPTLYNPTWYQTSDGWAHSSMIQPSENTLNQPLISIPEGGIWGELTVPTSEARSQPDSASRVMWRYYFGCTFTVSAVATDKEGVAWYQGADGNGGPAFFIRAEHVRPVSPQEFTPLSPNVPLEAKRIEVDLKKQLTTAYEYDKPVFSARVATGAIFKLDDGTLQNFETTPGDHRVFLKIPGQRMTGGLAGDSDFYDLPGISWVSYFTGSGIAFHGTYWHNDYGKPRSHGCVNMLPEAAKWVFRWTMPPVPYENRWTRLAKRSEGSFVKVF